MENNSAPEPEKKKELKVYSFTELSPQKIKKKKNLLNLRKRIQSKRELH